VGSPYQVCRPDSVYNGLTLSVIAMTQQRWQYSDSPDSYDGNHILFLRSNIETSGDPTSFHNRTGAMAINISENAAILIPVFSALYCIGSYYKGTELVSEVGARRAVREHISEGREMWAAIGRKTGSKITYEPSIPYLKSHYVESPLFRLTVSERNPFKDKLFSPIPAGDHYAVCGGYFILLTSLSLGKYIISFGSNGPGPNHSEAFYEVNVLMRTASPLIDVSTEAVENMKSNVRQKGDHFVVMRSQFEQS
jgi:hypothetical protein